MQADFVLAKWFPEELKLIWKKIEYCTEVIESFATIGIEKTMNMVNGKKFTIEE
jgi:PTH1 family peptidyl-tRNA hydrolase